MLYAIIAIAVFYVIYFFVSIFNSNTRLEKLYDKYIKITNRKKMSGSEIAFLGRKYLELNIKVAKRNGKLTDAYSHKKKVIILSEEVCDNRSIAAAGIVAHELGHAVQDKNRSALFVVNAFLKKFCSIFCVLALPLLAVGLTMYFCDFYLSVAIPILGVAITLFLLNILQNLLEIPLEHNASTVGYQFLLDTDVIDNKDGKKVKKLLKVAEKTYMADFFKTLIPIRRRK